MKIALELHFVKERHCKGGIEFCNRMTCLKWIFGCILLINDFVKWLLSSVALYIVTVEDCSTYLDGCWVLLFTFNSVLFALSIAKPHLPL